MARKKKPKAKGPTLDDASRDVFSWITALEPQQAVYDRWVKSLSRFMPEKKAKKIAAELLEEALADVEGTE
jgi:hypothetical protein